MSTPDFQLAKQDDPDRASTPSVKPDCGASASSLARNGLRGVHALPINLGRSSSVSIQVISLSRFNTTHTDNFKSSSTASYQSTKSRHVAFANPFSFSKSSGDTIDMGTPNNVAATDLKPEDVIATYRKSDGSSPTRLVGQISRAGLVTPPGGFPILRRSMSSIEFGVATGKANSATFPADEGAGARQKPSLDQGYKFPRDLPPSLVGSDQSGKSSTTSLITIPDTPSPGGSTYSCVATLETYVQANFTAAEFERLKAQLVACKTENAAIIRRLDEITVASKTEHRALKEERR